MPPIIFEPDNPSAPAGDAELVDLSGGDVIFECSSRGIYLGTGGDVRVEMKSGREVTYKNAVGGITHPWRVKRIFAAGTVADDIVVIW